MLLMDNSNLRLNINGEFFNFSSQNSTVDLPKSIKDQPTIADKIVNKALKDLKEKKRVENLIDNHKKKINE